MTKSFDRRVDGLDGNLGREQPRIIALLGCCPADLQPVKPDTSHEMYVEGQHQAEQGVLDTTNTFALDSLSRSIPYVRLGFYGQDTFHQL